MTNKMPVNAETARPIANTVLTNGMGSDAAKEAIKNNGGLSIDDAIKIAERVVSLSVNGGLGDIAGVWETGDRNIVNIWLGDQLIYKIAIETMK